ncbi:type I polyketide synthase [Candidatus Chloroploca sp. Khr17]|uniref:type I polyketide synthase n=1 Tax=Candidatus Chloroploca sp. Khr17 TaxID=2496869 RepID=UPI0013ECCA3E|nr:type I polyketide synthase [Candidatus Chloroploca sp. Khr17]
MSNPGQNADRRSLLQSSLQAIEILEAKLAATERARTEPIAVIGMSCRFPGGVDSPERFWQLLYEGRDAVTELPPERRKIAEAFGVTVNDDPGKPVWRGGFLDQIAYFDPQLFGITPREAQTMDPQQRLVLEVAWEALERAGLAPDRLAGSRTGLFLGISTNDYSDIVRAQGYANIDAYAATGGSMNVAAGRVSFVLGLQGPAMAVDTACSSSLVAVHLAVQSLRNGESSMALAGGVNVVLMPDGFVSFSSWGMMASDGRCKAFDARADGFVRAEGCGMLVLKRLSDAQAAGDPILAVIRGSAVNQDGRSSGLTVPNGRAQQAMLQQALANAGLQPAEVQYIEAHGTGTALGDPIEVEAIGAVLGKGRSPDRPLFLSSVKTNIGHAESAAGIAAMIKVILAMQHGEVPPLLHLHERSPNIPWPAFPIELPTVPTPWPASDGVRVAGVSGFGFSGTNAHVLLASAPADAVSTDTPGSASTSEPRQYNLITLSARSEAAIHDAASRLATHLAAYPDASLADVSYTANTARAQFAHRLAVAAASGEELRSRLEMFVASGAAPGVTAGRAIGGAAQVAFLFTGQGAQYAGMGQRLYASEPAFRTALDRCAELLEAHLDLPLLEVLFGAATDKIDQTAYTQPALFALEYALAELWRSWGVVPSALLGHSVGEYVAAVIAGVMSLEDGLRLIAVRGRLMQSLPPGGAMAAIFAPLEQVQAAVEPYATTLAIAAANGPEHTVISGAVAAVEAVMEQFGGAGVRVQRLVVSHAFHSPLMDPILDQFERVAASITMHPPRLPLISNLSGTVAGDEVMTSAYWRRHLREAVRFHAGVTTLRSAGFDLLLELGPHPTLLGMVQQDSEAAPLRAGLPSLRRSRDDHQQMLESLGQIYVAGVPVNLAALHQDAARRKVILPTYPFQRSRYWVDLPVLTARRAREQAFGGHPLLGRRTRSPLLRETLFESEVSAVEPAFLADHVVYDATVFPGTAYLELALAAAASIGSHPLRVSNLSIREPLLLSEAPYTLQLVLTPELDGAYTVQIAGFDANDPEAVHNHATGVVHVADAAIVAQADLAALRATCPEPVDANEFYAGLAEKGLGYGPAFRGVTALWRGEHAALGLVRLPEAAGAAEAFQIHPALLDACFHVIGAAMPAGDAGVPVGIADLTLLRPAPTTLWCYAERLKTDAPGNQALTCRLHLFDEAGQTVATLERLEVLRAPRGAWERDALAPWFHQVAWRPRPQTASQTLLASGTWLLLTDEADAAEPLTAALTEAGADVIVALPGSMTVQHEAGRWQVNQADPAAFDQLLSATGMLAGVVCLWVAPDLPRTLDALVARQQVACATTLHLVQALGRCTSALPRLWIVTRGTQPADLVGASVEPADATLWGLGKVIALENPGLRCTLVDLDPAADHQAQLLNELLAPDAENQVAFRGGVRLAARLIPRASPGMALPPGVAYRLSLPERGQLDKLAYLPLDLATPGPGEVAVTVHATGLNFRDVLNVLGMYPGDPGPPGIECAGVIAAVGEGVSDVSIGDAVVGLAPHSFDAVAITPANLVAHMPAGLSFAAAATVPSALLTAHYGLRVLADLQPGQRVLIHAAAGGVGLAAVQIALSCGAEVFATAGSPAKHAHLRAMGVQHIFSSRTANFREPLLERTGGHGVDVVLNSLSDDFISDSFAVLATGGCFLEIGKRGIWTLAQAAEVRPDVRYLPYDLGDVLRDEPQLIKTMLQELLAAIAHGTLAPLPLRAFSAEATVEAFRYMSQAKHIGKVVVTHRPSAWQGLVRPEGAYLITGGLGGLGLRVAAWLAERGAGQITLVGRREPSPQALAAITALREAGTEVQILAADVADPADVTRIIATIAATGKPLRGIFHAAGTLDDGVLSQQAWSRFVTVFAPKVAGSWNLHAATLDAPLDHFVLFSSASALLGNAGQANYAAANAFLDALAHARRAAGLPAVSLNWGAWAEVGMAAALDAGHQGQIAGRGIELIDQARGVLALERALASGDAQAAVLPVRWATLLEQFPAGQMPPLFAELARATPVRPTPATGDDTATFRRLLADTPGDQRQRVLVERLTLHVARVMGLDPQATDPSRSLSDLGIDSLMAVELKNRIDADLRGSVPVTTLLAGPTIEALAAELAPQAGSAPEQPAAPDVSVHAPAPTPDQVLANLDQLSDDDVDAMLNALLNDQGGA